MTTGTLFLVACVAPAEAKPAPAAASSKAHRTWPIECLVPNRRRVVEIQGTGG